MNYDDFILERDGAWFKALRRNVPTKGYVIVTGWWSKVSFEDAAARLRHHIAATDSEPIDEGQRELAL